MRPTKKSQSPETPRTSYVRTSTAFFSFSASTTILTCSSNVILLYPQFKLFTIHSNLFHSNLFIHFLFSPGTTGAALTFSTISAATSGWSLRYWIVAMEPWPSWLEP